MSSVHRPDLSEVADYTGVLRRRWWVVVALTLLCVVGALGYVVTAAKVYTSTASVFVAPTAADQSNSLANSRTQGAVNLDTEAQIVVSGTVSTMAGHTIHSTLSTYQLSKDVSVTVPPNSEVLQISCGQPTAKGAATCANAFAAAYLQNRSANASSFVQNQIRPLNAEITSLQKTISSLNATISGAPANSSQRLQAQAQLGTDQGRLNSLNSKVATLQSDATNTSGGRIITSASPPGSASSPKKSLILPSGLVAGLVLGLVGAFLVDRRDKRVHGPKDAERLLGAPVMLSLTGSAVGRHPSLASPRSRTGKAFTELAHAVANSLGEGSHVLLVAGATPGPGVSVIAANLAATLARTHSEAVLVCAALHDSVAPELLGLEASRGLAEVVAGRATVAEVARGPAGAPGLWVIPPGSDTSLAEYHLQHDTAKALTAQLRRDARYVIIEALATQDGADAFALADFADAALLTVETQRTKRQEVTVAAERLRRAQTPLLGAVLLPPIGSGLSVRPAQQRAVFSPGDQRRTWPGGRDRTPPGTGEVPAVSGAPAGLQQDRKHSQSARSLDGFSDPADSVPGT